MPWMQLGWCLNGWPTSDSIGRYCSSLAHRTIFDQSSRSGGVLIELLVLQIFEDTYIQACSVRVGRFSHEQVLSLRTGKRFTNPDLAFHTGLLRAQRLIRKYRSNREVPPVSGAMSWVTEQIAQSTYRLERQLTLFPA